MKTDDGPDNGDEFADSPKSRQNRRPGIFGRLLRRWWAIVLLSMIVTIPISYLIYVFIEPTYEAFSTLRIEPTQPELFALTHNRYYVEARAVRPYLETQVNVIVSDKVLEQAVANPQVINLPVIKQSDDPKVDLRKRMSVDIMDNAYMIRIALELPDANAAATIVNSVVEAYMEQNTIFSRSVNRNLQETLKVQLVTLQRALTETGKELAELDRRSMRGDARPVLDADALKASGDAETFHPAFSRITPEQYAKLLDEMLRCDIEQADAISRLSALKAVQERHKDETDRQLDARGADEFQKDPKVMAVMDQILAVEGQLDKARQDQPQTKEAVTAAQKQLDQLNEKYAELWEARYDQIRDRLLAQDQSVLSDSKVYELEVAVEQAKRKKLALARYVQSDLSEVTGINSAEARSLNRRLDSLLNKHDSVTKNLDQLKFEAEQDNFRIILQDAASVPRIALNQERLKYMTYAPLVVFVLILSLFLAQEIRAERAEIRHTRTDRTNDENR
jgi:polysaccharide biosynthesis transport protein